ncbi:zinc-binding alcohol dehydrogenase [Nisaea acidiphila]|uniref:Zinc-binding alcohol dehydrogenase n=1 Tax=Nisaea acidiphila TaxID=1862145 RepID=A0A9J7AP60_9PROT|nr:zinc-binding alcohol dehydrogenase [Nisaea acidiphila]UUX49200.1 zinc-binding alcohol dehydrogenase [Nisaea acidiphila]
MTSEHEQDAPIARAFWSRGDGSGEIRKEHVDPPAQGHLLVDALYSAVSKGTESLVFRGGVPRSEWGRMACPFQEGRFPGPVKYGYASVGRVADGAALAPGTPVFVLYPHQTRYLIPAEAALPLPETVTPERAVLAANMETALNAVWDAEAARAGEIAVIGGGVVGLLTGYLARRFWEAEVWIFDPVPSRSEVCDRLGLRYAGDSVHPERFSLLFHASATEDGLRRALDLAAFEATIIELSWYGDREVSLPLGGAFHSQRLTIQASQVGAVAPSRRPGSRHRERLAEAIGLLDDPALDVLITGESPFEDLPQVLTSLAAGAHETLCHRIRYSD